MCAGNHWWLLSRSSSRSLFPQREGTGYGLEVRQFHRFLLYSDGQRLVFGTVQHVGTTPSMGSSSKPAVSLAFLSLTRRRFVGRSLQSTAYWSLFRHGLQRHGIDDVRVCFLGFRGVHHSLKQIMLVTCNGPAQDTFNSFAARCSSLYPPRNNLRRVNSCASNTNTVPCSLTSSTVLGAPFGFFFCCLSNLRQEKLFDGAECQVQLPRFTGF